MREVRVRFLGCGDAFASGARLQTCILLEEGGRRHLVDFGSTALVGMKRWGVSPRDITTIVISHLHGDHFGGLPFFFLKAHFATRRTEPLVIAGPPGVEARVRQAQEVFFPGSSQIPLRFDVHFRELEEGREAQIGSLQVKAACVSHPSGAPSYALRVSCSGKVFAFSGDTEWTDKLVEVADGADLFVCECYSYEAEIPYHLNYKTIRQHEEALGAKRICLTHLSTDMLAHLDEAELEVADDGLLIAL